jgi:hypothetical protein
MFCIQPTRDQDIRATIRCQKFGGRRNFMQNRNFMDICKGVHKVRSRDKNFPSE